MSAKLFRTTKDYVKSLLRPQNDNDGGAADAPDKVGMTHARETPEVTRPPVVADDGNKAEDIKLYTIVYSEESEAQVIPGTQRLDHRHNERSDWREYSPIRRYLAHHALEDGTLYAFLSPKFPQKTGLNGYGIRQFIAAHSPARPDVFTFSPQADMGAFFLNTLEQGETFDPGFMAAVKELTPLLGIEADLGALVMDSRQVVFSNYFVANRKFWMRWLEVCEAIYSICEAQATPLAEALNRPTTYTGNVPRKVFVIERMASLLLATEPWHVSAYSTFKCAWSALPTANYREEAITSDALKMAFNDTRDDTYLQAFSRLRNKVFGTG